MSVEPLRVEKRWRAPSSAATASSATTSSPSGPSGRCGTCPGATSRPIPEARGSAEKKARRQDVWRSVVTQQYQADILAVKMAAQLLNAAPHHEARLYYSTMVQDESRHVEAWLKLLGEIGGVAERDPYLDELARMFLDELDLLEEKVFLMQVFFERLIIPRFRLIARSSRGTVLEDICNRLTIDDGIHHGAGMAYERVLLEGATKRTKQKLVEGRQPDAPDLRRARAVAAAGTRLDRPRDARPRRAAPPRGPRRRRAPGELARPRRQRRPAAVLSRA